ncbi:carbohydrate ABC transporter permease [Arthrobacter parietis]|jgi:multiple sugar transport system permease protein|uniref:Carbohydrate ABC transporter permease n=3 Tax=Arthrobacter TaxID=1663 RepID=A0ABT6CVY5_9MICC|nr:carbohydrate ABC transporter permease [Arthrobacter vasquezii]MDF9278230.1 carbohydrate ABC transporter permease [Arthrobacter vasquezii]
MSAPTVPLSTAEKIHSRGPRQSVMSRAAAMLIMGVFTLYFLTPIWWLLVTSTKSGSEITGTAALWFTPNSISTFFTNLIGLFQYQDGLFVKWLANSALYAGAGAVLGTIIAAMCGYALSKYEFRGRELIFNVVLSGVLVPATALALPLFLIFSEVNLTNTYWAVFLPSLVSPFGVYLARIYAAASVPGELLEAARLDGSGEVRTFFTVSSRLMAPALVTIFLFQFVAIWNNFFLPLIMLRDQALFPVTLGLYAWNSQISQIPELRTFVIIGALVSIVPLIIAFLGLQRFWSSGLSAGSVK